MEDVGRETLEVIRTEALVGVALAVVRCGLRLLVACIIEDVGELLVGLAVEMCRVAEAPDAVDIHNLEEVLVDRQHTPLFIVREEADELVVHQLALIVVVAHLQCIVEVLALDDVEGLAVAVEGDTTCLPR